MNKIAGGSIGLCLGLVVALIGLSVYGNGYVLVNIAGTKIPLWVFLCAMVLWIGGSIERIAEAVKEAERNRQAAADLEKSKIPSGEEESASSSPPTESPPLPKPEVVRFVCPNCDKKLKAPGHALGRSTRCPRCGFALRVPQG
jgi:hypothetical protein